MLVVATTFLFRRSVIATLGIVPVESQIRSVAGRFDIWKNSLTLIGEKPLLGWGPGAFEQSYQYHYGNGGVKRPMNVLVLILFARGFIGSFLLLILARSILWSFLRKAKSKSASVLHLLLLFGLVAMLLREMTTTSLPYNLSSIVLLGYVCSHFRESSTALKGKGYSMKFLLGLGLIGLMLLYLVLINSRVHFSNASRSFPDDKKTNALLDQANAFLFHNSPIFSLKALTHLANIVEDGRCSKETICNTRIELQKDVELSLLKAHQLNDCDRSYINNLGWYYHFAGLQPEAAEYFETLGALPDMPPVYYFSLALYYQCIGDGILADNNLTKGIIKSPSALFSEFFMDLKDEDHVRFASILNSAESHFRDSGEQLDAIESCKYAIILIEKGRVDSAISILEEALKTLPSLNRPWYYLAAAGQNRFSVDSLLLFAERSVFLDNSDHISKRLLARLYEAVGDVERSQKLTIMARIDSANVKTVHSSTSGRHYRSETIKNDILPFCLLTQFNSHGLQVDLSNVGIR